MNLITLVGRLGQDPEQKSTSGGTVITNFSLATEDGFGQNKKTNWHNIVTFGKTAEIAAQYLVKGGQVGVIGRVDYRSWDGNDGQKKYKTEIIADRIELLGGKPRDEFNQETTYREPAPQTESELDPF